MTPRNRRALNALVVTYAFALAGCARGCTSSRPPIHLNPSMDNQPKVLAQTGSDFFYNGASMRDPVPGTVAVGGLKEDAPFFTGKGTDGQFVAASPVPVNEALVERGRLRYGIYCQPCHDERGEGKGVLSERAKVPTANLLDQRIRALSDGEIFDTITNGKGLMAGYRYPIVAHDRWAIIAHVRDMQKKNAEMEAAK